MPVQLGQMAGYKQFTDWSNNTWQLGNPIQRKPQKGIKRYTTAEYTANPVTHFAVYTLYIVTGINHSYIQLWTIAF